MIALGLLDEEARTGVRATRARWRVEYNDGDHLNLRGINLRAVSVGADENGGFFAIWDLRERRALIAQGRSPNHIFEKRRVAARDARKS